MKKQKERATNNFNRDDLKSYILTPAREKLRYLEEMSEFLNKFMPRKSRKIWEELKKRGW